jgi:hypothetical protein
MITQERLNEIEKIKEESENTRKKFRIFEDFFVGLAKDGTGQHYLRECGAGYLISRVHLLAYEGKRRFGFSVYENSLDIQETDRASMDLTIFNEPHRSNQYILLRLKGFEVYGGCYGGLACGVPFPDGFSNGIYFLGSAQSYYSKDPYSIIDMDDPTTCRNPGHLRSTVAQVCGVELMDWWSQFFRGLYFSRRVDINEDIEDVLEARKIYTGVAGVMHGHPLSGGGSYDKSNLHEMRKCVKETKEYYGKIRHRST